MKGFLKFPCWIVFIVFVTKVYNSSDDEMISVQVVSVARETVSELVETANEFSPIDVKGLTQNVIEAIPPELLEKSSRQI